MYDGVVRNVERSGRSGNINANEPTASGNEPTSIGVADAEGINGTHGIVLNRDRVPSGRVAGGDADDRCTRRGRAGCSQVERAGGRAAAATGRADIVSCYSPDVGAS